MSNIHEINEELENLRVKRATNGTIPVKHKMHYAISRFSSLDETLNKSKNFRKQYVPIQPIVPWYVQLMVKMNDRLRHMFGSTLNSDIEIIEPDEPKEVTKYEPGKYNELSLVHTTVIERIGHKWRARKYWRIAGEKIHGRFDYIRCDGPNAMEYEPKLTYVPANFRRAKAITKGMKERNKQHEAGSQLKRNRIASVPMAIRYQSAVKLLKRLDEQALKAFHQGNMVRHDTLDNRANTVHEWIKHVASKFPDLFFKKPDQVPVTDKQKLAHDLKAMPKSYRVKSATDRKTATKLRTARIERQLKWSSRPAKLIGAHYKPKSL